MTLKAPNRRPNPKGAPPKATETPSGQENTKKGDTLPINFKTDAEFVKEWRVYCVVNDISQIDQFKKMFEFYKKHHG